MNEKSLKNLKKYSELTPEEIKAMSSKGGKKSAEIKRKRKALREELLALLSAKTKDENGKKETLQKKISVALINKAIAGDTKAFEVIRDTIGEKPTDKQEISGNLEVQKIFVSPEMHKETLEHIKSVINDT